MRNRELTDTGQGGASQAATMLKDVNALMQYYDIEINPDGCQWDLLLSMDASSDVRLAVEEEFRAALPQVQIQRIDEQNANALVPVDIHPKVDGTQTSWTALDSHSRLWLRRDNPCWSILCLRILFRSNVLRDKDW